MKSHSVLQPEIRTVLINKVDVREVARSGIVTDRSRLRVNPRSWPVRWSNSPTGVDRLAFNLEEETASGIILGDYLTIEEGDEVKGTRHVVCSVPSGERRCRSGARPASATALTATRTGSIDTHSPGGNHRTGCSPNANPVYRNPLQTGIKAIDAMGRRSGRGQRETDHR